MKKSLIIHFIFLFCVTIYAQTPEKMSYQAIIRDAGNAVVASTTIGMQISILKGSTSGTAVYVETQLPSTNINGLVSIEIGGGSVVSGTFADIDWSNDDYFVKTETDPAGGSAYSITGTSQLLSVPYALHAKNVDNGVFSSVGNQSSPSLQFVSDNAWRTFGDLSTNITLAKTSDVLITYHTSNSTPFESNNYFTTRININNGTPNYPSIFRAITGDNDGNRYFSTGASGIIRLNAGTYTISVEYRTNAPVQLSNNDPSADFMGRGLTIKELK
jgi:hypothetical protein